ncbi:hypothetical protein [Nostoc sp. FACHB-110]|uniref:hypothetical protein n=1 Tax=Nostoc sp. FACHB-110 TaxID=2692834 RepID=UPI0016873EBE|nr:hypothetical protein [Nostoc sp. FACHB-110]MBD2439647.1 hypothetical protein [Nostoc sp. FACHB-110]
MNIVICPGMHDPELTTSFISGWLGIQSNSTTNPRIIVFPEQGILTLSAPHILRWLCDRITPKLEPIIIISFSAGVVGAVVAAWNWHILGGQVVAFIAIDGWGVPLWGDFPIHRLSHDYFTHWSSLLLGSGHNNFYAEPAVDHLSMWRAPQTIQGWWVDSSSQVSPQQMRLTAAEFLHFLVNRYESQ